LLRYLKSYICNSVAELRLDKNYDRAGTIIKQTETTYKVEDSHYNIVGYVNIATGEVKDRHYDIVGYGSGENIWKAGVILLLFDK